MINYFAYGSNLHPVRLGKRLKNITFIATYKLPKYQLKFNKRGQDGSAKCNIEFTGNLLDAVLGAVYEIDATGIKTHDRIEGLNEGYVHKLLQIPINGSIVEALTYIAMPTYIKEQLQPFSWYKQLVLEGMLYHDFAREYISKTEEIAAQPDLNRKRNTRMLDTVNEIKSRR